MLAITTVVIFSIIIIINILLICGLPLGEFTMGGQYKILPKPLRITALFSLVFQIFAIIIILQAGGYIPLWFSDTVTKIICFVFAVFLSFNTVMNLLSKSKKEKLMAIGSSITAICFWITAIQM